MSGKMEKRVEIRITGRVQGVLFRHGAREMAQEFGITGWVRNEADGSVRIVAEGEEDRLRKLIEWCRKGTEWSRVENVVIQWGEAIGKFAYFEIVQ